MALIPLDGTYKRENNKLGSLGALPRGWQSLSFNALMLICASSAFTSFILIRLLSFYHVSRTISVHMAQDDSTYRGRNGIGCFHVSP